MISSSYTLYKKWWNCFIDKIKNWNFQQNYQSVKSFKLLSNEVDECNHRWVRKLSCDVKKQFFSFRKLGTRAFGSTLKLVFEIPFKVLRSSQQIASLIWNILLGCNLGTTLHSSMINLTVTENHHNTQKWLWTHTLKVVRLKILSYFISFCFSEVIDKSIIY